MVQQIVTEVMQVLVSGIDLSAYVTKWVQDAPASGSSSISISFAKEVKTVFNFAQGNVVEVYNGIYGGTSSRIFYGILISKTDDLSGISIAARDELWKANGMLLTKLYDPGDVSDMFNGDIRLIFMDLMKEAGLVCEDADVDQTSITLPQLLCDVAKIEDKANELARALQWNYYQDPTDRHIKFRNSANYSTYTTNLVVSDNVTDSPNYNENSYQVINDVEIQGIKAYPIQFETFTSDGIKLVYIMQKRPIATYVKVTNQTTGVVYTGAVSGSAGTYDYLMDFNTSTIAFTSPPANGNVLNFEYTIAEMTSISVDSPTSKAALGFVRKLVVVINDVITTDDALQRGNAIISESANSFANFTIKAYNISDLTPQNKINFIDSLANKTLSGLYIVNIRRSWPQLETEITLGKNPMRMELLLSTVEERVKKLERNRRENVQLTVVKAFSNDFYFTIDDFQIVAESIVDGTLTTLIRRKYSFDTSTELSYGTWSGNVNIYNGRIEFS